MLLWRASNKTVLVEAMCVEDIFHVLKNTATNSRVVNMFEDNEEDRDFEALTAENEQQGTRDLVEERTLGIRKAKKRISVDFFRE